MRATLAMLFVVVVTLVAAAQNQHGPYSGRADWVCHRGETVENVPAGQKKRVHCACNHRCDANGNAIEDRTCMTYCSSPQCVCHTDEPCEPSE